MDYAELVRRTLAQIKEMGDDNKASSVGSRWECRRGHVTITEPGQNPGLCPECRAAIEYRGGHFLGNE